MDTSGSGTSEISPEMIQFINQEEQKAMVTQMMSTLTSICWDKCISSPGSKLSSSEQACLQNCPQRYYDMTRIIMKKFMQQR